jgi:hypothetical protein
MYYVETRADNSGYTNHRVTCLVVMGSPFDSEQVCWVSFQCLSELLRNCIFWRHSKSKRENNSNKMLDGVELSSLVNTLGSTQGQITLDIQITGSSALL